MILLARPAKEGGRPQELTSHIEAVATGTGTRAAKFGAGEPGRILGLAHDIGKAAKDWQDYLDPSFKGPSPGHSGAGALLTFPTLLPLALSIAGHHVGLPSLSTLRLRIEELKTDPAVSEAVRWATKTYPQLARLTTAILPMIARGGLSAEFFTRMLFSALIDSDWLDTENHEDSYRSAARRVKKPAFVAMIQALDRKMSTLSREGLVNQTRGWIWDACVAAGERQQGVFRLTVPTGGGKTLASMGFALRHVARHQLDRVIVAIPYTSIIEQSAGVYRDIFKGRVVLEHHSSVAVSGHETARALRQRWAELASENWDAPIVVTTTVQLFDSMFANRPSKCRKLHNLARSVIILDEVQTLPTHLLETTLSGLRELVAHYGVTIVLCTATQPALDNSPFLKGFEHVQEIIPNPGELFTQLRRVRYDLSPIHTPWTWVEVASVMCRHRQVLTVVNTKADAASLYAVLGDDPDAFHLSANMCPAHRRRMLRTIRRRLKQGKPCRVVATTLIQAGVDLDFPVVLRAIGPLDGIVQVAGRCNRDGKLSQPGVVIVFVPAEGSPLPHGLYRRATDLTKILLSRPDVDLDDPTLYKTYFTMLYANSDLDKHGLQKLREAMDYPSVAEKYHLIEDDQVPVVVPYVTPSGGKPWEALLEQAATAEARLARRIMRQLQPFMVSLRRRRFDKGLASGLITEVIPGLYRWVGEYDDSTGLPRGQ